MHSVSVHRHTQTHGRMNAKQTVETLFTKQSMSVCTTISKLQELHSQHARLE
jgi:hypothetical protein